MLLMDVVVLDSRLPPKTVSIESSAKNANKVYYQ